MFDMSSAMSGFFGAIIGGLFGFFGSALVTWRTNKQSQRNIELDHRLSRQESRREYYIAILDGLSPVHGFLAHYSFSYRRKIKLRSGIDEGILDIEKFVEDYLCRQKTYFGVLPREVTDDAISLVNELENFALALESEERPTDHAARALVGHINSFADRIRRELA